MKLTGGIQLPNDVQATGYRKTGQFTFEQVFTSKKHSFTGTEKEFVTAGIGYEFRDIGNHKRLAL